MPSLNDTIYPKFYVLYSEKYGYNLDSSYSIRGDQSKQAMEHWKGIKNRLNPKANYEVVEVRPKIKRGVVNA